MKILPTQDKILVKPIKEDKPQVGGIIIPETVSGERPQKGEILAVGPGRKNPDGKIIPINLKVGDKIIFSKYSPTEIKENDEELFILSESDVLAIIE
uniref:Co-chaperonin GroES n=1 Tax=candidate division CPR3 bacterium TaxID=2268181 RepID=A0A7C4M130_UNCC3